MAGRAPLSFCIQAFRASPSGRPKSRAYPALPLVSALGIALVLGCAQQGGPSSGGRAHARVDEAGCEVPADASAGELAALRAEVDRLVAIQEIERLKARFMRCIDTKDLVCLRDEVFAPGAEIRFEGADYDIVAAGWTAIEEFYQGAFTDTKFGMHHAHTPEIEVDGETAHGTWYLHDVFVNLEDDTTLEGSALYDESYAKLDGGWRIMFSTYARLWEETTPRDPRTKLGSRPVKAPIAPTGTRAD